MMKYKRRVNNKLRGALGETYFDKKTIVINKKRHKNPVVMKKFAKVDRTLINTIVHEELHAKHPKMYEKTVRKLARVKVNKMSIAKKKKLYSKYK